MKKEIAEFIGTFTLVLFGCGAAVIAGSSVGVLGIALAFGLALIAMAYAIGNVSGCHINPAVTFAAFITGQMDLKETIRYIFAQSLGAIVGAFVLMTIVGGTDGGLGQNVIAADYNLQSAFTFEFIATAIFVIVILGTTQKKGGGNVNGIVIGLTLAVIHIVGINITGTSVNPARSLGPALFVGGEALSQLWVFIVAPLAGALLGAAIFKIGLLDAE
ncbi:MAG: aquaporin [Alphaproteobacteria bacterium]